MAYITTNGRPVFSEAGPRLIDRITAAWTAWRSYRETLAELRSLDVAMLDDIGLAGADLRTAARKQIRA